MLALIPARGGSKGIPRKNLRVINGLPLFMHAVNLALQVFPRVVVSTEDAEIAAIAALHGVEVLDRPESLAEDDVTIGQVAAHAADALDWSGALAVLQPTSPTLTVETVREAVARFLSETAADSLTTVTEERHILWGNHAVLTPRVNRQQAVPLWRETGGLHLTRDASCLVGRHHVRFRVPPGESIDIDSSADLEAARRVLSRRAVEFRVATGHAVGSGHERRCRVLMEELAHHDIQVGPSGFSPDVVVFDKLDTTIEEVAAAKAQGARVVCLEDLGPGSALADLVVNELYRDTRTQVRQGPKWAVLRPEFCGLPAYEVREDAYRVLVTFGGTDPSGLTERFAPLLDKYEPRVVRPGDGTLMAQAMSEADLVVSSAGRTAHEAAAVGVPCITVAANERESRHSHCPGILRLGLHATLGDKAFVGAVERVLGSAQLRREMSETSRAAVDGLGARRIAHLIDGLAEGL